MTNHIVKAYDQDLKKLHTLIQKMGSLTSAHIDKAIQSLVEHNPELAKEIIEEDHAINLLENQVDELAIRILALRQPVASDLRTVIAALKISNQVERIADYAANIAKRTLALKEPPKSPILKDIVGLVLVPKKMLTESLKAFETQDLELALKVWEMDRDVDKSYNAHIRTLIDKMVSEPEKINLYTQLLFALKNIERIGDQSQNIAEAVYTMLTGKPFKEEGRIENVS